jgi:anhydro-N-acetylmuramic acid kinase
MVMSIGLMSGTSMDGIDVALLETDGQYHIAEKGHLTYPYETDFQIALKAAEYSVRKHQGDLQQSARHFNADVTEYLNTLQHPLSDYYTHLSLDAVIAQSTQLHMNAVQRLLQQQRLKPSDIKVIGYHGQTLYHQPQRQCSIIIGDGQAMANTLKIPVVYQFRANDIAAGGQGAPFAPIYHWALAKRDGLIPCVVLNCGGIANATLIANGDTTKLIALDTGPGNCLIDAFVRQKTQGLENRDLDGRYGLVGKVNNTLLQQLYTQSLQGDKADFFNRPAPKSLDSGDFKWPAALEDLSIEDACRTLEAFTADSIIKSLMHTNTPLPNRWIIAGGGWHNPVIMQEFKTRLAQHYPQAVVKTANDIGWHADTLEAQIFAYLAVRHLQKLPFSFPGTTGVAKPLSGGVYCRPTML